MGLLLLAQRLRGNPSGKPVSLSTRDSKVPKPRQICNLNDHETALVPAKSVRKLTARVRLSKKFLGRDGALRPPRRHMPRDVPPFSGLCGLSPRPCLG